MKKLLAMIVTGFLLFANPTTASADTNIINITNTSTTSISSATLTGYIDSKTKVNEQWATFLAINNVLLVTFSVIIVFATLIAAGTKSSSN
ncbi:MAG: hypothetical protein LBJ98_03570 [Endomicrobium sp.]|jgi:hypothetical protein|nr:hypothetical protein [Endomicrobium sp.]